jgi:hypothetical protein
VLFGEHLNIEPRDLVTKLVRGVAGCNYGRQRDRTAAVKEVLRCIGEELGFCVAPKLRAGQPEFLYDMVWFKNSDVNDVVMAMESELDKRREGLLFEDFQKLLHIKAPLKIFVFQGVEADWTRKIMEGIRKSYLEKFSQHVKGERYIAIEFLFDENAANWWQLDIPANGPVGSGSFGDRGRIAFPC